VTSMVQQGGDGEAYEQIVAIAQAWASQDGCSYVVEQRADREFVTRPLYEFAADLSPSVPNIVTLVCAPARPPVSTASTAETERADTITLPLADYEGLLHDQARLAKYESALTAALVSLETLAEAVGELAAMRTRAVRILDEIRTGLDGQAVG
jgi:hypothetical protein